VVAISYADMMAEREVAWAAAAVSPMRCDSRAKIAASRAEGEGRGSAPDLMPRGFLSRGKRRDAG